MNDKYGFDLNSNDPIEIPDAPKQRKKPKSSTNISSVINAGKNLGFVNREPSKARKPGPKRKEPQSRITIHGPERVLENFRIFCENEDVPFWEGLEKLLRI